MRFFIFSIFLWTHLGLFAQGKDQLIESLQYQVDNMREQIVRVILDTDSSLLITDAEILEVKRESQALQAKMESIEAQNIYLRKKSETAAATEKALRIKNKRLIDNVESLHRNRYLDRKDASVDAKLSAKTQHIIDSISYEKDQLANKLAVMQQVGSVDESRALIVNQRESRVREQELRLQVREQMLEAREKGFALRLKEIHLMEEKYQMLAEKERQLKLIEQRLRALLEETAPKKPSLMTKEKK